MDESPLPAPDPVPSRKRHDGWTPERQRLFILLLAATRSVSLAAIAAGMSRESAYRLRTRPGAASFAAAWDAVLAPPPLPDSIEPAISRAKVVPLRQGGRVVGVRRQIDNRVLFNILRAQIARDGLGLLQ